MWWMRGRSDVIAQLTAREREGLAISVATLAELYEGVASARDPAAAGSALNNFLQLVTIIRLSETVAARFGKEAALLRRSGQPLPDFDLVIAATALHHGLILLTEDGHFARIAGLQVQSLSSVTR